MKKIFLVVFSVSLLTAFLSIQSISKAFAESELIESCYMLAFVSSPLENKIQAEEVLDIIDSASKNGFSGIVFSSNFDRIVTQNDQYFKYLDQIKNRCREKDMEIIPLIGSFGWGSNILWQNPNLAEGLRVESQVFKVNGNSAELVKGKIEFSNGGFERYNGDVADNYEFQEKPGEISFIDIKEYTEGKSSLRFQNFYLDKYKQARVMHKVKVLPKKSYRVDCSIKTQLFTPSDSIKLVCIDQNGKVLGTERNSTVWQKKYTDCDNGWYKITMGFNSMENTFVNIYAGAWGAEEGIFWIDDLTVQEVGLVNILRRNGTPLCIRNRENGQIYEEGIDYEFVRDTIMDFEFDHCSESIKIPLQSSIKDGTFLLVDYYHGLGMDHDQISVCMSEETSYDILEKNIQALVGRLESSKFFISLDEVIMGGTCALCSCCEKKPGLIMSQCVIRQMAIVRKYKPSANFFIWSDMFDPYHNADRQYGLCEGYYGAIEPLPKDITFVCWNNKVIEKSINFFASKGFSVMAGAYYDDKSMNSTEECVSALKSTNKQIKILYTTWKKDYSMLKEFSEMVRKK